MAAAPTPMPAPPGASQGAPGPTSPQQVATPSQPSPQLEGGSRLVIDIVQRLRALAQGFPTVAPEVTKINDLMRVVQQKMMSKAQPSEPAAPPTNG